MGLVVRLLFLLGLLAQLLFAILRELKAEQLLVVVGEEKMGVFVAVVQVLKLVVVQLQLVRFVLLTATAPLPPMLVQLVEIVAILAIVLELRIAMFQGVSYLSLIGFLALVQLRIVERLERY